MSDKKVNKSSLKEAKEQFEEIQKFAIEEATKNLQKDVSKKVIELMNNSLQEEVIINAGDTVIKIDDSGNVEVESSTEIGNIEAGEENSEETEEIEISDENDEIEIDNSEMEDMNLEETNFEEQEAMAAAPEAMPAPDAAAPIEEPVAVEEPVAAETIANPFQALMDKMDQMMSMMGGQAGGEEIDIIDDTEAAQGAAPVAPEAAPVAPVAEEITFEVVNNEMEIPEMEDEVLEIVGGGTEEDTVEEMHGVGHNLRHSNRLAKLPRQGVEHRKEMNENKAQYEAKLAELIKENESLKTEKEELEAELIKFENGFLKLQENFGQMQDYNAKLVMAYKVAMSGGLTSEEKIQISEQFDNCETVEDAEKLYKSIVSEHKIKVNKNPEKSIKSTSIKSTPAKSVSQPLYESKEVSRMKQLAGIRKNEE
ncbi:MAG: hypothetical protein AABY15_05840 [Nanoarchaeota archaeon]